MIQATLILMIVTIYNLFGYSSFFTDYLFNISLIESAIAWPST